MPCCGLGAGWGEGLSVRLFHHGLGEKIIKPNTVWLVYEKQNRLAAEFDFVTKYEKSCCDLLLLEQEFFASKSESVKRMKVDST